MIAVGTQKITFPWQQTFVKWQPKIQQAVGQIILFIYYTVLLLIMFLSVQQNLLLRSAASDT